MKVDNLLTTADIEADHVVVSFKSLRLREQNEIESVSQELEGLIDAHDFRVMVLNFQDVRMLTSSFLGRLLMLRRRLKSRNIELRACNMQEEVFEGFNVLKLQKLIPVFDSINEALE